MRQSDLTENSLNGTVVMEMPQTMCKGYVNKTFGTSIQAC